MIWERPLEPPDCWPRGHYGIGSSGYSAAPLEADDDKEDENDD